jgi:hypothetical protein
MNSHRWNERHNNHGGGGTAYTKGGTMNDQVSKTIRDPEGCLSAIWISTAELASFAGNFSGIMGTDQRFAWADKFHQLVVEHINTVNEELKKLRTVNEFVCDDIEIADGA